MAFPPKFPRKDYSKMREGWLEEGYSCPLEAHLNHGRYWKEFPVMKSRIIHAWYKKVSDVYIKDYSFGRTNSVPYNYDWPKP